MNPLREMSVLAAARIMNITDKRIWRVVFHYASLAMAHLSLHHVMAIGLNEAQPKEDIIRPLSSSTLTGKNPVLFATSEKGKDTLQEFRRFLELEGGRTENIVKVVCEMSKAFFAGAKGQFQRSEITSTGSMSFTLSPAQWKKCGE